MSAVEPAEGAPSPGRVLAAWARHGSLAYAGFAMCCAIYAASSVHAAILAQTGGAWVAPSDEAYVHFEHARALLAGRPFAWTAGAGYTSGDLSITWVALLVFGPPLGFGDLRIALWAALLGGLAAAVFLVVAGQVVSARVGHPGGWSRFLIPPLVLSVGGVLAGLSSGLEIALLLALWALALAAGAHLRSSGRGAGWLGLAAALVVATRWEAILAMIALALASGWRARRSLPWALGPPLAIVAAFGLANTIFTGELLPASVLAGSPLLAPGGPEIVDALGAVAGTLDGSWLWLLGAASLSLLPTGLRATAAAIAVQALLWVAVVAVCSAPSRLRFDLVPAVGWLAVLASQGLAVLASRTADGSWLAKSWPLRAGLVVVLLASHAAIGRPRIEAEIRGQAAAARRLFERDLSRGLALAESAATRLLVPALGALSYAAGLPALDLSGRGGFRGLPFATASRHGLGASLELVERVPPAERPDVMAAFDEATAELALPFGVAFAALPTRSGPPLPLLQCRFTALDRRGAPRSLDDGERVLSNVDLGDLVSEREHEVAIPPGPVRYAILADPRAPDRDLFDAGRPLAIGARLTARVASGGRRVLVRLAPTRPVDLTLGFAGAAPFATLHAEPRRGWQELSAPLPASVPDAPLTLEVDGELVIYHLWILGR